MSCIWMRLKINFPWCHPRALCSAHWAEGLHSASLCKIQRLAMFLLPPQSIAFWAPLMYVVSTASYGNGFPCLIMIFVENNLSWVCLFVCFKLANCSLYWNHQASCVMKDSEKAFLIPFLSTVLDFMRLCHKAFPRLFLFQYENPKAVFSFLVQKPLHTFDHPVTMYFLFLPCPF